MDFEITSIYNNYMNKFLIFFLSLFLSNSENYVIPQENFVQVGFKDTTGIKEKMYLKNYAFCKCLQQRFPLDTLLKFDGSLEGYIEIGSYGNYAYGKIDSFVQKKCASKYKSKYSRNLFLMQCIDMYNSPELDSIVRSLDLSNE